MTEIDSRSCRLTALLIAAALSCGTCAAEPSSSQPRDGSDPRRSAWADPIAQYPGLPNLFRVSDGLYRGAQPTEAEGYASLAELGIKTVVNLRAGHDEEEFTKRHGLDYVHIPMRAWSFDEEDVIRFLRVASRAENQPIFVHCRRGADRAGMIVAVYRVVVEGWSKDDALFEMTEGPYDYNSIWRKLARFVEEMDVDKLREAAGLTVDDSGEAQAHQSEATR